MNQLSQDVPPEFYDAFRQFYDDAMDSGLIDPQTKMLGYHSSVYAALRTAFAAGVAARAAREPEPGRKALEITYCTEPGREYNYGDYGDQAREEPPRAQKIPAHWSGPDWQSPDHPGSNVLPDAPGPRFIPAPPQPTQQIPALPGPQGVDWADVNARIREYDARVPATPGSDLEHTDTVWKGDAGVIPHHERPGPRGPVPTPVDPEDALRDPRRVYVREIPDDWPDGPSHRWAFWRRGH